LKESHARVEDTVVDNRVVGVTEISLSPLQTEDGMLVSSAIRDTT